MAQQKLRPVKVEFQGPIAEDLKKVFGEQELPAIRMSPPDCEHPNLYVLQDMGRLATGKSAHDAARDVRNVLKCYPELAQNLSQISLYGRGLSEPLLCGSLKQALEYIMLLPGQLEHLAETDPNDWRRAFGLEVERGEAECGELPLAKRRCLEQQVANQQQIIVQQSQLLSMQDRRMSLQEEAMTSIQGFLTTMLANQTAMTETVNKQDVRQQQMQQAVQALQEQQQVSQVVEMARGCDYDPTFCGIAVKLCKHGEQTAQEYVHFLEATLGHIPVTSFLEVRLADESDLVSKCTKAFAMRAKAQLLETCARHNRRPFALYVQNAWRPAYFKEDEPMLETIFRSFVSQKLPGKGGPLRTAAVLVIFASDTPLLASTELHLRPPSAFLLPSNNTCEHFEAANEELPFLGILAEGCSLASTPGGGPEIRITLPGALKGQRSYAFAVTAQSPVVEPPSPGAKSWREQNIWNLEVWVQSVAAQRLLYVGDGQGFPLVPKLQEATVYPFRALGDAYLTQSFLLPRGASLVSLRVEFAIPFVSPGSLGQRLEVAVEAPEGFSLGSGGSCEVRSLQLGRDVVPESWYDCSAPSPLSLLLSSRVPPPAELEGIGNELTYKAEIFPALPPVDAEGAENRLWNLRAFACTTSLDPLQEESDAATGSQDSSLCALLAASTGIPSWTMSGYLHVDQLIVEEADSLGSA
ncbi:unnamed protein product [Symbiodinium sp. CCMP2456]|nr:unnamed protein product [Symbiodinium sp. CCMP2456]